LAEEGVYVVCIEPSPAMRRQFEDKLERRPHLRQRIRLVPGEATAFRLPHKSPAAFLSGTFDHFVDREERLASLRNVVRHLEPGGTLVFDVFLGMMESSPLSPAGYVSNGEWEYWRLVGRQAMEGERVRVRLVFEIYRNGELVERIEEESIVGITDRDEIHRLLGQVNCSVRREFADYDRTPYGSGGDLLIVEAECRPVIGADGRRGAASNGRRK
jgi:SAM-dependent methyltransferase